MKTVEIIFSVRFWVNGNTERTIKPAPFGFQSDRTTCPISLYNCADTQRKLCRYHEAEYTKGESSNLADGGNDCGAAVCFDVLAKPK